MITEYVLFDLPSGITRDEVVEAWRQRLLASYGSEPSIRYFETPLVVDNAVGKLISERE